MRTFASKAAAATIDCNAAIANTRQLAMEGYKGRPLKTTYLISLQQAWNALPLFGSLDRAVDRAKDSLHCTELRLVVASLALADSAEGERERGFAIRFFELTVDKKLCKYLSTAIAFAGYHSITRRFQRGYDASDNAILADLASVCKEYPRIVDQDGSYFCVQAMDGMPWKGRKSDCPKQTVVFSDCKPIAKRHVR